MTRKQPKPLRRSLRAWTEHNVRSLKSIFTEHSINGLNGPRFQRMTCAHEVLVTIEFFLLQCNKILTMCDVKSTLPWKTVDLEPLSALEELTLALSCTLQQASHPYLERCVASKTVLERGLRKAFRQSGPFGNNFLCRRLH